MTELATDTRAARFFGAADDLFTGQSESERGQYNLHYIEEPVRLADGRLPGPEEEKAAERTNPLAFLTGLTTSKAAPMRNQRYAVPPFVALVVGQYGLGKTEMMFRLKHHMQIGFQKVLAINLGLCRDRIADLDLDPSPQAIIAVLFGRILERAAVDRSFVTDELQPQIRRGDVVLILDGLDELISAQRQHNRFFTDLMRFLSAAGPDEDEPEFRVIVTMRLEYLAGVTTAGDASDLARLIRQESAGVPSSVYFLVLDYLGDEGLKAYLGDRLPDTPDAFEKIRTHDRLLDMIRRPLLLRLFCDLVKKSGLDIAKLLAELRLNESPVALLDRFVGIASADQDLSAAQGDLADFTWDPKKIAVKTLDLYRNGRDELSVEDVRFFLKPARKEVTTTIASLPAEEVLKGIHKCPFLRQDVVVDNRDGNVARFAHRVFYEYFTARAMAEELSNAGEDRTNRSERAFDELVLNVDMRKFLRGMLDEEVWYTQTRKSYGLDNLEEWKVRPAHEEVVELNEMRRTLLDAMTDPERMKDPAVLDTSSAAVRWFLDQETRWLHPRYLTYNYEAVAVYLWYRRFYADAQRMSRELQIVLEQRLESILGDLDDPDTDLRKPKSLLLERILDIGRRFWYPWAKSYASRRGDVLALIGPEEQNVGNRIARIFDDIDSANF